MCKAVCPPGATPLARPLTLQPRGTPPSAAQRARAPSHERVPLCQTPRPVREWTRTPTQHPTAAAGGVWDTSSKVHQIGFRVTGEREPKFGNVFELSREVPCAGPGGLWEQSGTGCAQGWGPPHALLLAGPLQLVDSRQPGGRTRGPTPVRTWWRWTLDLSPQALGGAPKPRQRGVSSQALSGGGPHAGHRTPSPLPTPGPGCAHGVLSFLCLTGQHRWRPACSREGPGGRSWNLRVVTPPASPKSVCTCV